MKLAWTFVEIGGILIRGLLGQVLCSPAFWSVVGIGVLVALILV